MPELMQLALPEEVCARQHHISLEDGVISAMTGMNVRTVQNVFRRLWKNNNTIQEPGKIGQVLD